MSKRALMNAPMEELVDPFYAEYRRKRRLRRGSLSGNVDDDTDPITMYEMQQGMGGPGGMAGQPLQQNNGLGPASSSFFNTHSQGPPSPGARSQGGLSTGGVILLLDTPNSEYGNFYGQKLEQVGWCEYRYARHVTHHTSHPLSLI